MGKKHGIQIGAFVLLVCIAFSYSTNYLERSVQEKEETPLTTEGNSSPTPSPTIKPTQTPEPTPTIPKFSKTKDIEELLSLLTLEEKAAQMVQGGVKNVTTEEMSTANYGSVLDVDENMDLSANAWKERVIELQKAAMSSSSGIPFMYGTNAVHGVNYCKGAVIFPHNIGIGAANDEILTYKMGKIVGEEMKLTGMLWNFGPCVAIADDQRWGRTYESYSTQADIVSKLAEAFVAGQREAGVMPCAKHFLADGQAVFGTGEGDNLIDRGDATLTETEITQLLYVYRKMIDAGANTIMINHGSINGIKMHANKELITDKLKGLMQFNGMVVSDWESIHNIEGASLKEKTITAVNAGIDMLMEPNEYNTCMEYIVDGVREGKISMDRIDDAVRRILTVKQDMGLFDDPYQEKLETSMTEVGSEEAREVARQLVEKSLVLLKNEKSVLPLRKKTKIYVTGPAANDTGVQSGGWTVAWQGGRDDGETKFVEGGTTILEALQSVAKKYNLTIITDPKKAEDADVTLLCIGEKPYAQWYGDTQDLSITGPLGLEGNKEAIEEAKALKNKTVTLLIAGRHVLIDEYLEDWESVVMCYLPGTEGDGVVNALLGKSSFTGKLAMPWYKSIGEDGEKELLYGLGYGREK